MQAPVLIKQLEEVLKSDLKEIAGIKARVVSEPVPRTRLYRFYVVSDDFEQMQHSERQEVVWRIVRARFGPPQAARISMILTVTTDEIGEEELPATSGAAVKRRSRSSR